MMRTDRFSTGKASTNLVLVLCLIILFSLLYRGLDISRMWAFGDLIAFPTDLSITGSLVFSIWSQEGMGLLFFKPFNYYLLVLASSLVLGSFAAQKVLFLSLLGFSFLSFYALLRKLDVSFAASVLGALAYSLNPVTTAELLGGSATLVVYCAFPLLFLYLLRIIQTERMNVKDMVILGLLSFFLFNLHSAFWYIIILIPMLFARLDQMHVRVNLGRLSRLSLPCVIAALILLPNLIGYAYLYTVNTSKIIDLESEISYSYKDATFYNLVRLAGNKGSAQAEEFLNYNTIHHYTILGYVIPILGILSFISKNPQHRKGREAISFPVAFSLLASFGLILLIKALPSIANQHPILGSLRNPVKIMYPLSFSLCFLFALGAEKLLAELRRRRNRKWSVIVSLTLIVLVFLYNYPVIDGTMGFSRVRDCGYCIEDKYYLLPELLKRIDHGYNDYRVLLLPWDYATALYAGSQMPNYFGVPSASSLTSDVRWLKDVFELVVAQESTERSDLLGLFGVKYVVIDKEFRSRFECLEWYRNMKQHRSYRIYEFYYSYWVTGDPSYFYQIFRSDQNFKLAHETDDFAVFTNENVVTKIHIRANPESLTFSYAPISGILLRNPSFVDGKEGWRAWPDNLVRITNSSGVGNRDLVLYGQEDWWTNLCQTVPVMENGLYRLGFSVKGHNITDMHAKVLWFDLTENLTESNAFVADYVNLYQMNLEEGEWSYIEEVFSAPESAELAMIWFGANRLGNYANTSMCIRGVSFNEVKATIWNFDETLSSMANVSYTRISPTKYVTRITASSPLVIALSETYDASWVCYVNNQKSESFPLYGMINGFWINQKGQLDITIEYEPQRCFFISSIISISTLLACFTYLSYDCAKNKAIWRRAGTLLHRQ